MNIWKIHETEIGGLDVHPPHLRIRMNAQDSRDEARAFTKFLHPRSYSMPGLEYE